MGSFFQRQIVKRLLRCLVDEDVALVRIVIFLGIPGLAISGVDILLNLIIQAAQILRCAAQYATLKAGEASLGHKITDSRNSTNGVASADIFACPSAA